MVETEELAVADPALLARLRRIDDALTALQTQQDIQTQQIRQIADAVERRNTLMSQWIDPAIDLTGLMAQLAEIGRMNARAVAALAAQITREHADTRESIDLAVGAAGLGEAEA